MELGDGQRAVKPKKNARTLRGKTTIKVEKTGKQTPNYTTGPTILLQEQEEGGQAAQGGY